MEVVKYNFEDGVCLCQRMVMKNLIWPMPSKIIRLLRAVSIITFYFPLLLALPPPFLTQSMANQILGCWPINHQSMGKCPFILFIFILIWHQLSSILRWAQIPYSSGWSEREESFLTLDIINSKLLPHELKQEHKTSLIILKVLKVAHEKFTWRGGEIPHK